MSYDDFGVNSSYLVEDFTMFFPRPQVNLQSSVMENKNLIGMLAGYYLSRFDEIAYKRFPFSTQSEVHSFLAERIGVPASSLKLWRDEFDPIHPNSRKGWHKRKMAPSRVRMSEMLLGVSEMGVFQLLNRCMERPNVDVLNLLQEADMQASENSFGQHRRTQC